MGLSYCDDRRLFESSPRTFSIRIELAKPFLTKRETFRSAFQHFGLQPKVALLVDKDVEALLDNKGFVA